MLDFEPPVNKHGKRSNIEGYGCCVFNDLTRNEWAKIVRYIRNEEDI